MKKWKQDLIRKGMAPSSKKEKTNPIEKIKEQYSKDEAIKILLDEIELLEDTILELKTNKYYNDGLIIPGAFVRPYPYG